MQASSLEPVIWGVITGCILIFFVFALRRARQRRRAEFSDDPVPVQRLDPATAPDPEPSPAVEPEPTTRPEPEPEPEPTAEPEPAAEVDEALKEGLAKTQQSFFGKLNQLLGRRQAIGPEIVDELEELLLTSDVGVALTTRLVDSVRKQLQAKTLDSAEAVRGAIKSAMIAALGGSQPAALELDGRLPHIILFVGVNGVGKTTTIGKVAARLKADGKRVVMAAGDTFRAAAVEQLTIWGERTDSRVIRGDAGADPASVIFNAIEHGIQTGADVVLADTAGRLHTKSELMDEIRKVKRAAGKALDGAPDETWLVVDATTGQNAVQQAREFHRALGLTGIILTKLDGTAKGGVVVAIADALDLPVRFVGVGEKPDDLRPFEPRGFIEALFAT